MVQLLKGSCCECCAMEDNVLAAVFYICLGGSKKGLKRWACVHFGLNFLLP